MVLIGLGSNRAGPWGTPAQTLREAVRALRQSGLDVRAVSGLYETEGVGGGPREIFVNAVIRAQTHLPPDALLRRLKRIERRAGRRSARPWGPRALDLDVLDYKGLVRGWAAGGSHGRGGRLAGLVLPHPRLHLRPFVVRPLLDVCPGWRHPALRVGGQALWRAMRTRRRGRVLNRLGSCARRNGSPGHLVTADESA